MVIYVQLNMGITVNIKDIYYYTNVQENVMHKTQLQTTTVFILNAKKP